MLKTVWTRLKSPVVIVQLLTIIGTAFVLLEPGYDQQVKEIVGAVAIIVNVIAGLNNPTNRSSF